MSIYIYIYIYIRHSLNFLDLLKIKESNGKKIDLLLQLWNYNNISAGWISELPPRSKCK